eukprot:Gb_06162 [translate_table: standard]
MVFQGRISEALIEKIDGVNASIIGLAVVLVAWIFFKSRHGSSDQTLKLPPRPPPLPIIGNLHMLGKLPHRKLQELSKKYGPIMFLRLGSVSTIVASSPEMAKEFLKTHDLIFSSRSSTCAGKNLAKRLESMKFIREEEVAIMRESIMKQCAGIKRSNPVNISKLVSTTTMDIICRMAFGRKYSEETLKDRRGFKAMIQEAFYLADASNNGNFLPYLEWMDLQDFVDVMLELSEDTTMDIKITRDNIKAVIFGCLMEAMSSGRGHEGDAGRTWR